MLRDPKKFGLEDRGKLSNYPKESISKTHPYYDLMSRIVLVDSWSKGKYAKLTPYAIRLYESLEEEGYYKDLDKNLMQRAMDVG